MREKKQSSGLFLSKKGAQTGTEMRSIWVVKQTRREATVSCHPDHVGTSFACSDFFCKKISHLLHCSSSFPKSQRLFGSPVPSVLVSYTARYGSFFYLVCVFEPRPLDPMLISYLQKATSLDKLFTLAV